ncbi:MAG: hypothetical protein ACR2KQ_02920 [Actinomycetota bacterium]
MRIERWGPTLAVGLSGFFILLAIGGVALKQEFVEADFGGIPFLAFGVMGGFVAARQPRNPIGWLFLVVGGMPMLGFFSSAYATRAIVLDPGSLPFAHVPAWISSWAWIPGVATLLTFCLLLYPDGRLPSRRWRFVPLGASFLLLGAIAGTAFMPGKMEPFEEGGPRVDNPFGIEGAGPYLEPLASASFGLLVLFGALSVASLVCRFRASRWQQRQQIKWFMYPAAVLVAVVVLEAPLQRLLGDGISALFFIVAILLLPVGTGVGILKHGLFDIDVVINRTLVYLSLTALLVGAYLGVVLLLQQVLSGVTVDSDIAVAASTLVVAALFRPLRSKVQRFIDRRFYRHKYDAATTVASFSNRVRDEVDLDELSRYLIETVRLTMQPAHMSIWIRQAR